MLIRNNQKMYFQPDTTWTVFGIKTQEEYIERYVFKGKFHTQVHEDVIKSYKTAEYLMAHAYYHYPMYDEAYKKMLNIFEMAVKLRCKDMGIPLEVIDKNGKRRKRELFKLIEDFIKKGYPEKVRNKLDWLREMRNMFSHPDRHSFGGGMFAQSIVPIINILNQLFLPIDYFLDQLAMQEKIKTQMKKFKDHVFILPYEGKHVLSYEPELASCLYIKDTWFHVFSFKPIVPNPKKFLEDSYTLTPLILTCTDLEFQEGGFRAFDYETKSNIQVLTSQNEELIKKCETQKTVFENMPIEQKIGFDLTGSTVHHILSDFMYSHCWNSQVKPI